MACKAETWKQRGGNLGVWDGDVQLFHMLIMAGMHAMPNLSWNAGTVAVTQNVQNLIKLRQTGRQTLRVAGLLKGAADYASVADVDSSVEWVVGKRKRKNAKCGGRQCKSLDEKRR